MTSNKNFVHLLPRLHEEVTFNSPSKQLNSGIFIRCQSIENDERQHAQTLLEKMLIEQELPPKELEVENYGRLKHHPQFICSKTHTKSAVGVICGRNESIYGVGIDLEKKDRSFNPKIEKFFKNEEDEHLPLLDLWCAKEACFKSLANDPAPPQTLKQIWVRSNQFGINNSPKILGEWINLNVDDYILSIAYLRNLSTSA